MAGKKREKKGLQNIIGVVAGLMLVTGIFFLVDALMFKSEQYVAITIGEIVRIETDNDVLGVGLALIVISLVLWFTRKKFQ